MGSGNGIEIWREGKGWGERGNIEIYNKSFLTSDTRVRKREARERERKRGEIGGGGYKIIPT